MSIALPGMTDNLSTREFRSQIAQVALFYGTLNISYAGRLRIVGSNPFHSFAPLNKLISQLQL